MPFNYGEFRKHRYIQRWIRLKPGWLVSNKQLRGYTVELCRIKRVIKINAVCNTLNSVQNISFDAWRYNKIYVLPKIRVYFIDPLVECI